MDKTPDLDTPSEDSQTRLSSQITGFVDYNPKQQYLFNTWLQKVASIYETFGFTPLHLRPFERISALQGEGDTQKQIFELLRFDTQQTTGLALPFDHTVPLALWIAEHAGHLQHLSFPYKRYDLGLSYRGERPKTGRLRAFVQADVDIVGRLLSLSADAECIATIFSALSSLDIGQFQIRINHIGIVKSILKTHNLPSELHPPILRAIDKLDKLSAQEIEQELKKIDGYFLSAQETGNLLQCFMTQYPLSDVAHKEEYGSEALLGIESLQKLTQTLEMMGIDSSHFVFAPGMVRGLAYYTGIVFETLWIGREQFGSIAGGGRYSNLVGDFSKNLTEIEGVGGSLGLTRIFDIFCKTEMPLPNQTTVARILVGARTQELMPLAYQFSAKLRQQGHKIDLYSGSPKVKHILSHASALGIPQVVLIMDQNSIVIKNMKEQTQQEYASLEEALLQL